MIDITNFSNEIVEQKEQDMSLTREETKKKQDCGGTMVQNSPI